MNKETLYAKNKIPLYTIFIYLIFTFCKTVPNQLKGYLAGHVISTWQPPLDDPLHAKLNFFCLLLILIFIF